MELTVYLTIFLNGTASISDNPAQISAARLMLR